MDPFTQLLETAQNRRLPPVHLWQPERVGSIDIRIAADGTWFHEGVAIRRIAIARVFSTILRLENGQHYLVTPPEKLAIEVEDAPFIAVDMESSGEGRERRLVFATNLDDAVQADAEHPITVAGTPAEPRPYVEVRDGLRALIARSVFYRLVDIAETESSGEVSIWSAGARFVLGQATD
ncbi:MAG: DUF1285 domain-containing protein [Gammaproteobacteria bacterium]|nr:DUF1285 domain-containing protein [Gammaproteobacteria bacterium]MYB39156.1 DUF1285 domain-containing protein [Gammaproteobacteria bacterium]